MKIGLVTPYIYPVPGGVNEHVRHLYENLRLHGHDVRIISSSHGLQRASEGDVIRLGKGFSVRSNGSVGTVTVSPRYVGLIDDMLERERFDILHFHEPFVPFLSLILLRRSRSVNIATFHAYAGFSLSYEFGARVMQGHARLLHGRIAVSAAARHFIDRYFPGDYKIDPERGGRRALPSRRARRSLAGRPEEPPVPGSPRAEEGPPRPPQGLPDPQQDGVPMPSPRRGLGTPGARGASLRDDPAAAPGSSSWAG